MFNCDCYIAIRETIQLCVKKGAQTRLRMLSTKCVYNIYIYIYIYIFNIYV